MFRFLSKKYLSKMVVNGLRE